MPVHNLTSVLASIAGRGLLAGSVELSGEHIGALRINRNNIHPRQGTHGQGDSFLTTLRSARSIAGFML